MRKTVTVELSLNTPQREKYNQGRKFGRARVVQKKYRTKNDLLDINESKKRAKEFYEFLYNNASGAFYQELAHLINKNQ